MKKYAIIVAGGSGVRMGTATPKQFLLLQGRPVLWHTLEAFLTAYDDLEIILVLPAAHLESGKELMDGLAGAARIQLVSGGDTRFHSVRNGLAGIKEQDAIVFVHDGVRCLVSKDLVQRCYEQAVKLGSAIPAIDAHDSVRLAEDEGRSKPIDRTRIKLVQTPQTFRSDILLKAYAQDHQETFTDEATVVEVAGHPVFLIEGEASNIKITLPGDIEYAGHLLAVRMGNNAGGR